MAGCPPLGTWEQLLAGDLDEPATASLRAHLCRCSGCQMKVEHLSEDNELRTWMLQACHLANDAATEAALARIMARLHAVPPARPSTVAPVVTESDLPSLLGPPQQEGDLGSLGSYAVQKELGRGGMGIVLRAWDPALRRIVALKVLRPELANDQSRARFVREAQAAASISHDHVVRVYAVARPPDGLPYMVMEYLAGPSLAELIDAHGALAPRTAAALVAQVAEGVAAAHAAGLIHRDIKPSNILLEPGTQRAKITDFGLARLEADPQRMTQEGVLAGTPAYMSPEQAQGQRTLDSRSDVYSLGATLYEALTGQVPFRGAPHMVLQQVVQDEPCPPRQLNDRIPRALETICLKAMAKQAGRRYPTALELADDLCRWQHREPIRARPTTRIEQLARWCWRNPRVAILTAALLLVFVLGFAGVLWQWQRAEGKSDEAAQTTRMLERQVYKHRVMLAQREWLGNGVGQADALLDGCPSAWRGWEWFYCKRLCHADLCTLPQPGGEISGLACSPDGRLLACARTDGALTLWETTTGREVRAFAVPLAHCPPLVPGEPRGNGLAFRPDGQRLAQACRDGTVHLYDVIAGREVLAVPAHPAEVKCVAFSSDGQRLVTTSFDGGVKVWDLTDGCREVQALRHDWVVSAAFSPDGTRLASAGMGGTLKLWDTQTGKEAWIRRGLGAGVFGLAFRPDGTQLASAGWDQTIQLWDVAAGRPLLTLRGHTGFVRSAIFRADGKRLVSCSEDNTVRLWDSTTGAELSTKRGHKGFVLQAVFCSSTGERIASAGDDGVVKLWDAEGDQQALILPGHRGWVRGVAFSPGGRTLAAATGWAIGELKLWRPMEEKEGRSLPGHEGYLNAVCFSPDGTRLASASDDGTVKLWDPVAHQEVLTLRGHTGPVYAVAFSPDSQRLASAGDDHVLRIWDVATGQSLQTLPGHPRYVYSVAFAPDGRRLASAGGEGTVRLWDLARGQEVWRAPRSIPAWTTHRTWCHTLAFSPDGVLLAAAGGADQGQPGDIQMLDAATGARRATLQGHARLVNAVAFSPDGRRLASVSNDRTVKLWNPATGEELFTLRGHRSGVLSVAFSPDGHRIASGSIDFSIRVWDATPLTENRP